MSGSYAEAKNKMKERTFKLIFRHIKIRDPLKITALHCPVFEISSVKLHDHCAHPGRPYKHVPGKTVTTTEQITLLLHVILSSDPITGLLVLYTVWLMYTVN